MVCFVQLYTRVVPFHPHFSLVLFKWKFFWNSAVQKVVVIRLWKKMEMTSTSIMDFKKIPFVLFHVKKFKDYGKKQKNFQNDHLWFHLGDKLTSLYVAHTTVTESCFRFVSQVYKADKFHVWDRSFTENIYWNCPIIYVVKRCFAQLMKRVIWRLPAPVILAFGTWF